MRVGLIADVHGNRLALDAVLDELEREGVDEILCLGDVAVGPQPAESLARIRELGCPVVMGNWDAYFACGFPEQTSELGRRLVEIGAWWSEQLTEGDRAAMRSFVRTLELPLDGNRVLAFHGSPRSYEEFIFAATPDHELARMLDGAESPLMVCGHTHFQMARRHGDTLLVNPGSVGLPFAEPEPVMHISPWAEYGIIEAEDRRLSVDLRRTSFDVWELIDLMLASGMPHAEWWASLWRPPTAAK